MVLIQLKNQEQIRAKLSQLSVNGGLLQVAEPLEEKLVVEVMFHLGSAMVRAQAETISPLWATQGYLQPFRFTDLGEEERRQLDANLQSMFGIASAITSESLFENCSRGSEGTFDQGNDAGEDRSPTSAVTLYFDNPQDALQFTLALSAVIFSENRVREDVARLAREINKVSRVTTKGVVQPSLAVN